jgi:ubiquitin-protein ligase
MPYYYQECMAEPYFKRLTRERTAIAKERELYPNIYYSFDDANMLKVRSMIIGPAGTPYADCPLVYDIEYPKDYPHEPPKVVFITSDGATRFHPNMYVDGKVCLSILGTWSGPKWSPALTTVSVMATIQSLLDENPLRNEPGDREALTLESPRAKVYADAVRSRLTSFSFRRLCRWKVDGIVPSEWIGFEEVLEERGDELLAKLYERVKEGAEAGDTLIDCREYGSMMVKTDWASLAVIGKNVLGK